MKKAINYISLLSVWMLYAAVSFNPTAAPEDEAIFQQKLQIAQAQSTVPAKALEVMRSFLGTPYIYASLEGNEPEALVVNLRGLDCWTSVENCIAIALTANDKTADFNQYKNQLRSLRYWGGTINGYGSRIHYFSGWLLQAEKMGVLKDLTHQLGGVRYTKTVSFMTDNPQFYARLGDAEERKKVEAAQKRISQHEWYYIPKSKVAKMEHKIQDGDLIIMTSSLKNLDVEHQGFAIKGQDGRIHLLHASSYHKKVIMSPTPLSTYLTKVPAMSGIMVARLNP